MKSARVQSLRALREEMKAVARGDRPSEADANRPSYDSVEAAARRLTRDAKHQPAARLGTLPPRYTFLLNPYGHTRFTRCPVCNAPTRVRKVPLVVHVEHSAGPRLAIVGKSCRLCVPCDLLIAHEAEVARVIVAAGVADDRRPLSYVVLGTVERGVWRRGLDGDIALGEVRDHMADFTRFLRVDVTPGGWHRTEPASEDN